MSQPSPEPATPLLQHCCHCQCTKHQHEQHHRHRMQCTQHKRQRQDCRLRCISSSSSSPWPQPGQEEAGGGSWVIATTAAPPAAAAAAALHVYLKVNLYFDSYINDELPHSYFNHAMRLPSCPLSVHSRKPANKETGGANEFDKGAGER
jgi:hypothetical protein